MIELDPVDRITAGAVGEPGQRVFFLQGRQSERLVTILDGASRSRLLRGLLRGLGGGDRARDKAGDREGE